MRDGQSALPRTFRPRWAPRIVYPIAVLLLVVMVGGALSLPGGGARGYGFADRGLIIVLALALAAGLHRLASVRITCRADGVVVRNILRVTPLEWAEIVAVRLPPSAPWLVLDLDDGTEMAAMGIQGSDGAYARAQAGELAALVERRSSVGRDD